MDPEGWTDLKAHHGYPTKNGVPAGVPLILLALDGSTVERYMQACSLCLAGKALPRNSAGQQHISSKVPLDLVWMDFLEYSE